MKKNYIIPSVEITNIQMMQMIALSAQYGGKQDNGVAESKTVNFYEDSESESDNNPW